MSVINQMLKDLEQRSPEQGQASVPIAAAKNTSLLKTVLLITLILLSLNALGFYIWSLQERVAISESKQQKSINFKNVDQVLTSQTLSVQKLKVQEDNLEQQQEISSTAKASHALVNEPKEAQKEHVQEQFTQEHITQIQPPQEKLTQKLVAETSSQQSSEELKPIAQSVVSEQLLELAEVKPSVAKPSIENFSSNEKTIASKMSVSRRSFTSKELVEQKLARAEKAVNSNEITEAEQLFEEVLIINPAHKQARKKLAALWFGRQSFQQAVNLLSQGIALDNQDEELRLMKARIHLKQGQLEAAYNTLKPLASIEQEEYQVMLANIAQQIEQYQGAIGAYQVLIEMQPYSGRWHLGLAIVYDKNSQFLLAVNEYALALTKTDLSASSAKFAQQRMQALGE